MEPLFIVILGLGTNHNCKRTLRSFPVKSKIFETKINVILSGKRLKVYSPKSEVWKICPILPLLCNITSGFSQSNWPQKWEYYSNLKGKSKTISPHRWYLWGLYVYLYVMSVNVQESYTNRANESASKVRSHRRLGTTVDGLWSSWGVSFRTPHLNAHAK